MNTDKGQKRDARRQLLALWRTFKGYWGIGSTGRLRSADGLSADEHTTHNEDKYREEPVVMPPFCRHSSLHKLLVGMFQRFVGRADHTGIRGLCPICGLLPQGDRAVEYVLRVWFADGDVYDYCFRHREQDRCYRFRDGVLEIYLADSVLSYSVDFVTTVQFGPRVIPADPPEVTEAERILAELESKQQ